jgi:hypothetical protein
MTKYQNLQEEINIEIQENPNIIEIILRNTKSENSPYSIDILKIKTIKQMRDDVFIKCDLDYEITEFK